MSYGFVYPCYKTHESDQQCPKVSECSDQHIIAGAITAIHTSGSGRGHKGGGTIRLECANKQYYLREAEEAEKKD
jgi:hypothetical protein